MTLLQNYLTPQAYRQLQVDRLKAQAGAKRGPSWRPNPDHADGRPNPQRLAYESPADVLGYGGAAGGGKTALLLGLAATRHKRSAIFRRVYPNLRGVIEESRVIFNADGRDHAKDSYNETLHRWQLADGRMIEFEACQMERDKEKQRGRPRDFYGFDEATEFTRSQVEFITAWNRSTDPNQRCRVVLTFNPPTDDGGSWVIDYFRPWFAYLFPEQFTHPHPAAPGELRWYATIDGRETECDGAAPFDHDGETITPVSRTFIPARLEDNRHLADTNYRSMLQALPEPLRSQLLYGNFAANSLADPWQVIPTAWVKTAQARWMETEKPNRPLAGVGVDVARGGRDSMVIAKRYANWFDEPVKIPGVDVQDGPTAAGLVAQQLAGEKYIGDINIDVIGVGSSPYDSLAAMYPGLARAVNVAEGSAYAAMSATVPPRPLFKMKNKRAEMYWRFREALDPESGDNLALPPGNELVADLCAAHYKVLAGGVIQIEEKESIKKRIGRSPDVGEAVMLAHYRPSAQGRGTGVISYA
jgi:hypothetical protein